MSDSDDFETLPMRSSNTTAASKRLRSSGRQQTQELKPSRTGRTRSTLSQPTRKLVSVTLKESSQSCIISETQPIELDKTNSSSQANALHTHIEPLLSLSRPVVSDTLNEPLSVLKHVTEPMNTELSCPICAVPAHRIDGMSLEMHVNQCLDSTVTSRPNDSQSLHNSQPTVQILSTQPSQALKSHQKVNQDDQAVASTSNSNKLFYCPVCTVNLSGLSSDQRERHTNTCLDKSAALSEIQANEVEQESQNQSILSTLDSESAKLLDLSSCLFCTQDWCSKTSFPIRARISHIKACAKLQGISPKTILKSIKHGKRVFPESLDRFLLSDSTHGLSESRDKNSVGLSQPDTLTPVANSLSKRSRSQSATKVFSFYTGSEFDYADYTDIQNMYEQDDFEPKRVHINVDSLVKGKKKMQKALDKQDIELQTALAMSASAKDTHDQEQRLMLQYGGCTVLKSNATHSAKHRSKRVLVMSKLLTAEEAQAKMELRRVAILRSSTRRDHSTTSINDPFPTSSTHIPSDSNTTPDLLLRIVSDYLEKESDVVGSESDSDTTVTQANHPAYKPTPLLWHVAHTSQSVADTPCLAPYKSITDYNDDLCLDNVSNFVASSDNNVNTKKRLVSDTTDAHVDETELLPSKRQSLCSNPSNTTLKVMHHQSAEKQVLKSAESEITTVDHHRIVQLKHQCQEEIAAKRLQADKEIEAIEKEFESWSNQRTIELQNQITDLEQAHDTPSYFASNKTDQRSNTFETLTPTLFDRDMVVDDIPKLQPNRSASLSQNIDLTQSFVSMAADPVEATAPIVLTDDDVIFSDARLPLENNMDIASPRLSNCAYSQCNEDLNPGSPLVCALSEPYTISSPDSPTLLSISPFTSIHTSRLASADTTFRENDFSANLASIAVLPEPAHISTQLTELNTTQTSSRPYVISSPSSHDPSQNLSLGLLTQTEIRAPVEIVSVDSDHDTSLNHDSEEDAYVVVQPVRQNIETCQRPRSISKTCGSGSQSNPGLSSARSNTLFASVRSEFSTENRLSPAVASTSGLISASRVSSTTAPVVHTDSAHSAHSTRTAQTRRHAHTVPPIVQHTATNQSENTMSSLSESEMDDLNIHFTSPHLKRTAIDKCHKLISEYIRNDATLHQRVLLFEPLDFDILFQRLLQLPELKGCTRKVLASFLDKHGIGFKTPAL
ncbi:hypothetical protein O5D80_008224 [Batrachochytrium dendrobatidis]|nr:hypothetical protein O5D80_008224 [Batrachochytrium dendrobatidis]